jgi:hypothetical protein
MIRKIWHFLDRLTRPASLPPSRTLIADDPLRSRLNDLATGDIVVAFSELDQQLVDQYITERDEDLLDFVRYTQPRPEGTDT